MLTVTKDVKITAEVEVEIDLYDISDAVREANDELALIGMLIAELGAQDTLHVMHLCMERMHQHI